MTRAEIQRKINELTRRKNNYNAELNEYRNALNYANKLVSSLSNGEQYLNTANDQLKKYFTINGKTGDGGKITNENEKIKTLIKDLNNTIIPNINSNIKNINNNIYDLNRQINILRRQYANAES